MKTLFWLLITLVFLCGLGLGFAGEEIYDNAKVYRMVYESGTQLCTFRWSTQKAAPQPPGPYHIGSVHARQEAEGAEFGWSRTTEVPPAWRTS